MAKKIELPADFTFSSKGSKGSKYPWSEWFNGDAWFLTMGEDFPSDLGLQHWMQRVQIMGRSKGVIVQVDRRNPEDLEGEKMEDAFILKARPMTATEKAAEAKRRAGKEQFKASLKEAVKAAGGRKKIGKEGMKDLRAKVKAELAATVATPATPTVAANEPAVVPTPVQDSLFSTVPCPHPMPTPASAAAANKPRKGKNKN